jgi:hypothetical protein
VNSSLLALVAALCCSCSRPTPPAPETSANWQANQISLDGEWYPAVALSGAADSLADYLTRTDFSTVQPRPLTVYLDQVLPEEILPQHRQAYDAALDAIFVCAQQASSTRGIIVQRGSGTAGPIQRGPDAKPELTLKTHFYDNAVIGITITNQAREPYSWVRYSKPFRGVPRLHDEQLFP